MSNTIRIKRGTTDPTAGVLVTGELAIDTTNGTLYSKLDDGSVTPIVAKAKNQTSNVRNETGSTIGAFKAVYITGASSNKALVSLAQANSEATSSKTFGVTSAAIATNANGDVVCTGLLDKVDTSSYTAGQALWLSPSSAGDFTTTAPTAPNHAVFIGIVVRSHATQGSVEIKIQNGYELGELHNLSISSLADKDIISYNSSTGLYENRTATALGLAPLASPTFTGNVTAGQNLISANSSGDEGGEILLAKPQTNTTLDGTGVTIDVYQNKLRIFEQGGSARGAYIDLTAAGAGVATNLLSGGSTSASWGSITGTLSSQTDLNTALGLKAPLASPALTGNVTITTNSSSPALVIVQDGTGDVLQLKDVTSDTTYSFIDQNGKINTNASTTSTAGLRIPTGSAPSSPVSGDFWATATLLNHYNGTTTNQFAPLVGISVSYTGHSLFQISGSTTGSSTINIANAATPSGSTKTVGIGTNSAAGSSTSITIGSSSGTSITSLLGSVTATTPTSSDNSTKLATTAYVKANLSSYVTTTSLSTQLSSYTPTAYLNNSQIATSVITELYDINPVYNNHKNAIVLIDTEMATSHTITFVNDIDDGGIPVGSQVVFVQMDTNSAYFQAAAGQGVTLVSRGSRFTMNGQYAVATAIKTASNIWVLSGDLV